MAQGPPTRRSSSIDPQVGAEAESKSRRILPPAHENKVGRLQPSSAQHSAEYGTRKEAQRSARVRGGPRNAAPEGAESLRSVHGPPDAAFPAMARSKGGAERTAPGCGGVDPLACSTAWQPPRGLGSC